jgi:hypothetical protein
LSLKALGDLFGTLAQSVMRWGCGYVDHHWPKPEIEPVPIVESDEMRHYMYRKTNQVWIWKVCDRALKKKLE